jgi:hypothetical protein
MIPLLSHSNQIITVIMMPFPMLRMMGRLNYGNPDVCH